MSVAPERLCARVYGPEASILTQLAIDAQQEQQPFSCGMIGKGCGTRALLTSAAQL